MVALDNWAGNVQFQGGVLSPVSWEEVQRIVASQRTRPVGAARSFWFPEHDGSVALSTSGIMPKYDFDARTFRLKLDGYSTIAGAARTADALGAAFSYLPSIGTGTVAGSVATWTHGSGSKPSSLASQVLEIELITPEGLMKLSTEDADFLLALCSVGTLGVVRSVVFQLVPQFGVHQNLDASASFEEVLTALPKVLASAYSVSAFLDIRNRTCRGVLRKEYARDWVQDQDGECPECGMGHLPGQLRRSDDRSTFCLGTHSSHLALPHFKEESEPDRGSELQSEVMVPLSKATEFINSVCCMPEGVTSLVRLCEVRSSGSDTIALGGSQGESVACVHFTLRQDPAGAGRFLRELAVLARQFRGVPHLGKLFNPLSGSVEEFFPQYRQYYALKKQVDPKGLLPALS